MRIGSFRSVKARCSKGRLCRSNFLRWHKEKLRFRIEETTNQPAGRSSINPDFFTSNPFHSRSPFRSRTPLLILDLPGTLPPPFALCFSLNVCIAKLYHEFQADWMTNGLA